MKGRNSLLKSNGCEIGYPEENVINIIGKWQDGTGWNDENFLLLLKQIGIEFPIKLTEHQERSNRFKCIDNSGNVFILYLKYTEDTQCSEIRIEEGIEEGKVKITYYTSLNPYEDRTKEIESICIFKEIIKKVKKLYVYYGLDSYVIKLYIKSNLHILIKVSRSEKSNYLPTKHEGSDNYDFNSRVIPKNHKKIEDHVMGLEVNTSKKRLSEEIERLISPDYSLLKIKMIYLGEDELNRK